MKKLLLPRGYLSWTQVDMWLRSPERYARRYFENEDGYENEAMAYGKRTSEALEKGGETGDDIMDAVVALLPKYDVAEHQIEAPWETPKGIFTLLGKLDTFGTEPPRFREYKTGIVPWTRRKAEKHRQLHHYAALIWLFHKKLPSDAWLDWAQTERTPEGIQFTGKIESFRVEIGTKEVLEYLALAGRVAQEIDEAYRSYLAKMA